MAVHALCTLSTSLTTSSTRQHYPSSFPSSFSSPSCPRRILRRGLARGLSPRRILRPGSPRGLSSKEEEEGEKVEKRADSVVLNLAWYSAEALGNVVSFFSPAAAVEPRNKAREEEEEEGPVSLEFAIQAVRKDYDRSYFLTGDVSPGIYEEDCEFADPVGSFRSLKRFTNNCRNFGAFLEKSDLKLMKLEELQDKFIVYWRFSCILKFPWRPVLSSTGYTEYYWNPDSGKICRHKENWDVPKMVLLGQLLKPNPSMGWK